MYEFDACFSPSSTSHTLLSGEEKNPVHCLSCKAPNTSKRLAYLCFEQDINYIYEEPVEEKCNDMQRFNTMLLLEALGEGLDVCAPEFTGIGRQMTLPATFHIGLQIKQQRWLLCIALGKAGQLPLSPMHMLYNL